jgi:hypothetical protein
MIGTRSPEYGAEQRKRSSWVGFESCYLLQRAGALGGRCSAGGVGWGRRTWVVPEARGRPHQDGLLAESKSRVWATVP